MEKLVGLQNPVLIIGPTGSGKSLNISNKLLRNMPKRFVVFTRVHLHHHFTATITTTTTTATTTANGATSLNREHDL